MPFLVWGDFHSRSRFAGSTIPEEKKGDYSVYRRVCLCDGCAKNRVSRVVKMDHSSNSPPGSSSFYAAAILKDERTLGTRLTTSFFIPSRHPLPSDQTPKVWRSRRKSLSLLPIFFISQVPFTALTILTAGFWRAAAGIMCVDKDVMYVRTISSVVPENAAEISVVQRTAAIARPVGDVVSESAARIMSA